MYSYTVYTVQAYIIHFFVKTKRNACLMTKGLVKFVPKFVEIITLPASCALKTRAYILALYKIHSNMPYIYKIYIVYCIVFRVSVICYFY